jgi:hypothetical protein
VKAGQQLARPQGYSVIESAGSDVRAQLERIASQSLEIETDECLASRDDGVLA